MASEDKGGIVILLDKNKLSVFDGRRVVFTEISSLMIKDMDVINGEALKSQILTFFSSEHITPSYMIFVLSESVCFISELPGLDDTNRSFQFQQFYDSIPFNSVIAKKYQSKQGTYAVATNLELVNTILESLEPNGFKLLTLIPSFILDKQKTNGELNMEVGKYLLSNFTYFATQTMLERQDQYIREQNSENLLKRKNNKVPLLLLVFSIALAVLVLVIFLTR